MVSAVCYADNAKIVINQKSGNETVLELSDNPVITFSGEDMVVTTYFTTISIPIDDIVEYTVNESTTVGIDSPSIVSHQNGQVPFHRISLDSKVSIYTIDGRRVNYLRTVDDSDKWLNLDRLPKGTYIICKGDKRIKVINK